MGKNETVFDVSQEVAPKDALAQVARELGFSVGFGTGCGTSHLVLREGDKKPHRYPANNIGMNAARMRLQKLKTRRAQTKECV
jgi:hypothetical protein